VSLQAGINVYRLAELETVIERGLATFVEVGEALLEIRDSRLYRIEHETFEAYCRAHFPTMTYRHARRLMDAADVVALLDVPDGTFPRTEAVARELVPLRIREGRPREVWDRVVAEANGAPITAPMVRAAVRDHMRGMAAESEAELQAATAHWTDEQRAAVAPARMRAQGELMRLTGDLAALPDPVEFVHDHRDLPGRVIEQAENAHAWLSDFLSEWRHQ